MQAHPDTEQGAHRRPTDAGTHRRRPKSAPRPRQHYPISEILHIPGPSAPLTVAPASGWRKLVYTASFRGINPGESPIDRHARELRGQVRQQLRKHFVIGVLSGKGGVGKTTLTASIGGMFREHRPDNVVAIDAAPGFGTLAARIDPAAPDGYPDIINRTEVRGYTDIRGHLGENGIGLDVLAGNPTSDQPRPLVSVMLREVLARLERTHQIILIDTADNLEHPVMKSVLDACDALVFVSGLTRDTSLPVARSIDLLHSMDYHELVSRSTVVLNDSRNHYDPRARSYLTDLFTESEIGVGYLPYDPHLAEGGIIDTPGKLRGETRFRLLQITAALTEQHARGGEQPDT